MEAVLFGIRTTHAPGCFCKRVVSENFFIACFETPYMYERNGILTEGAAGDVMIIPPGMPVYHGSPESARQGYINDWIYLQGDELQGLLDRYPLPLGTAFSVGHRNALRRYLEAVTKEYALRLPGYTDQLLYLTGQLIIELYRLNRRNFADRIERAREEILGTPEKGWTLEQMAALSGYSVSRFSALYRERFGRSPKQDLLTARIELAAKMLKYTNASVTEVADTCGFQTIYYFSKYFKQVMGISPREYASTGSFRDHPGPEQETTLIK